MNLWMFFLLSLKDWEQLEACGVESKPMTFKNDLRASLYIHCVLKHDLFSSNLLVYTKTKWPAAVAERAP